MSLEAKDSYRYELKIPSKKTKAERMLRKVFDVLGGEFWFSRKGVPILTVACYNIIYKCKTKSFRLFIQNEQENKIDCKLYLDVINHLQRRTV